MAYQNDNNHWELDILVPLAAEMWRHKPRLNIRSAPHTFQPGLQQWRSYWLKTKL
jgi:hypothetical protein